MMHPKIDYLVGGLRISLGDDTTTPGPTNHIQQTIAAFERIGSPVRSFMSSDLPLIGSVVRAPEGAGMGGGARAFVNDGLRIAVSAANSARVNVWSRNSSAAVVYERAAVMTHLSRFHRSVRTKRALSVVESNGIFSRETRHDRNALRLEALARTIEVRMYQSADLVVAVSDALADEIARYAEIADGNLLVVPNAVPHDLASIAVEPAPKLIFGFAGAVVEWQSLAVLIRAFANVRSRLHSESSARWNIEIVGDGPALPGLQSLVADLELQEFVHFLPRVSRPDLYQIMRRWAAGVSLHAASSSSVMYHSPLKLYDYAGMGLISVCTPSSDAEGIAACGGQVLVVDPSVVDVGRALLTVAEELRCRRRQAFANRESVLQGHSWDRRVMSILEAVEDRNSRGVSSPARDVQ